MFEKARAYKARNKSEDVLPVVLLDEVGLAEVSRHNPLKVRKKGFKVALHSKGPGPGLRNTCCSRQLLQVFVQSNKRKSLPAMPFR